MVIFVIISGVVSLQNAGKDSKVYDVNGCTGY